MRNFLYVPKIFLEVAQGSVANATNKVIFRNANIIMANSLRS